MNHKTLKVLITLTILMVFMVTSWLLGRLALGSYWAGSAVLAVRADRPYQAVLYANHATQVAPSVSVNQYIRGASYLQMAQYARDEMVLRDFLTKAVQSLQNSIAINSFEGHAWSKLAEATFWLSRINRDSLLAARAQEYIDEALRIDPNNPLFLYQKVQYSLIQGRREDALRFLPKLARSKPDSFFDITYPGWRKYGESIFEKELSPLCKDPLLAEQALRVLSFIAASNWQWLKAASRISNLINKVEEHKLPPLYQELSYFKLKAGDREGAVAALVKGLQSANPTSRRRMLASVLHLLREERALDVFQRVVQQASTFDVETFEALPLYMGQAYYYQGNLEKARYELNRALESGEKPLARLFLAKVDLDQELYDEAEIEAQRGVILDRVNPELYFVWAKALLAQKKHRSALSSIESALRYAGKPKIGSKSKHVEYFDLQAAIYQDLRNLPRAIESWQKAAQLSPLDPRFPSKIGNAYLELGELKHAERWYSLASKLSPGNKVLAEQLKIVRNMQGKINKQ